MPYFFPQMYKVELRERTGAPICHLLTSFREHEERTEPAPDRLAEWTRATTRPAEEKTTEEPAPCAQLSLFDPGESIQPTTITQVDWSGETIVKPDNPCILLYGTGPEGKQCKDCASLVCFTASKNYYKCRQRPKLTHGKGTDQKVRWPACARFEQRQGDIPIYDGRG